MARCPQCKEPISQFAAGCAVCGADLEAHRQTHRARRPRPTPPRLSRLSTIPDDVATALVVGVVILAFPIFGLVLAAFAIHRQRASTRGPLRAALYGLAVVGTVFLLSPTTRYGVLALLP